MRIPNLSASAKDKLILFVESIFVMCWVSVLKDTDSRHSIYSMLALISVFCMNSNVSSRPNLRRGQFVACSLFSVVFSAVVALANYSVFLQVRDPVHFSASTNLLQNLLNLAVSFVGGIFVCWNILTCMIARLPIVQQEESGNRPGMVFALSFALVVLVDLVYLFLDEFPGHVTPDSVTQLIQTHSGVYTNHHPFWHTVWIKVVMSVGYGIFGNANGGVALFSVLQILFMAACFAYGLMTLYQAGVPKWCVAVVLGMFALLPYNIALSITMWKDVPFAGACLVLVVVLYRIFADMDRRKWISWLLLGLSTFVMCLSRTNGLPTLIITLAVYVPFLMKHHKRVLAIMAGVLAVCVLLTGPVLDVLDVEDVDITEALSIPLQQFARVITEERPLTEEESQLLSKIFDLEEVPTLYTNWLSDPIKIAVRQKDAAALRDNLADYGKLWVQLGMKYPGDYVKAWVDQTKGYWNGGYDYHQYAEMVEENPFGIAKTGGVGLVSKLFYLYFGLVSHAMFMEPLLSIGLQVWILAACMLVNFLKKRKEFLLSVPCLCIILGLLVGTPVYSEFRYAYAVFLVCPMVLLLTFYGRRTQDGSI